MKELSIKEKAKAYDKAIERSKSLLSGNQLENAWIYKLLPELKENEDELTWLKRFIKEEIDYLSFDIRDSEDRVKLKNLQRSLAWLEKQGNLMKALQISNAEIGELIEKNYYLKEQLEKQGNNMGISEATKQKLEDNLNKALEKETPESWNKFLEKQGEQKPAWSEEDDKKAERIIRLLQEAYDINCINGSIDWLKSLKDRYTWKPSSEQVSVLEFVMGNIEKDSIRYRVLNSVLKDLKKLSEK